MHSSLISTQITQDHLHNPKWRFFDCRNELTAPEKKKAEFAVSHIPGALYVHMNQDLATTHVPGKTGRHPLPSIDDMAKKYNITVFSTIKKVAQTQTRLEKYKKNREDAATFKRAMKRQKK